MQEAASSSSAQSKVGTGGAGWGMTILSTVVPALGIPVPAPLLWSGFGIGVVLICWTPARKCFAALRRMDTPQILMAVGLAGALVLAAVALGGFIWSQFKTPAPIAASEIVLTPPLASPSATSQEFAGLRRKYIGQSKILFDETLTNLSRLINGKGAEAVRIADRFLPAFAYQPMSSIQVSRYQNFKDNPQEAKTRVHEIYEALWGKMLRENRDQLADLNDVIQNGQVLTDFTNRMDQVIRYHDSFRQIYETGDVQTARNAALLFSILQEPTQRDVSALNDWIEGCNRRIEAKRKALDNEK